MQRGPYWVAIHHKGHRTTWSFYPTKVEAEGAFIAQAAARTHDQNYLLMLHRRDVGRIAWTTFRMDNVSFSRAYDRYS